MSDFKMNLFKNKVNKVNKVNKSTKVINYYNNRTNLNNEFIKIEPVHRTIPENIITNRSGKLNVGTPMSIIMTGGAKFYGSSCGCGK